MKMRIKMVIELCEKRDIEKYVYGWAEQSGFSECSQTHTKDIVDFDNVTYCYNRIRGESKAIIAIHQLDSIVRIQAWIIEEAERQFGFMHSVNELLLMLGHWPIA
jgi:hypothetical protein